MATAAFTKTGHITDLAVMPFGEHRGDPLDSIDTGYLRWWLKKMDSDGLRAEYREAVVAILQARGDRPPAPRPPPRPEVGIASAKLIWAAEIRSMAKAWFSQMTLKYHPDRGGSNEQQMVVLECYRSMMDELKKWESSR